MRIAPSFVPLAVAIAVVGGVSACSSIVEDVEDRPALQAEQAGADPALNEFLQQLSREYDLLADSEEDQRDWSEFDSYEQKAEGAKSGVLVEPSRLEDREIPETNLSELANAAERLEQVFDRGAREISGVTSARAQAFFDCWLREAEEGFQSADIAACRAGLLGLLPELENSVERTLVVLLPGEATSAVTVNLGGQSSTLDQPYQALSADNEGVDNVALSEQAVDRLFSDELSGEPLPSATFILTFESGGSDLTPEGQRQFERAVVEIGRRDSADVTVVGHTDTVGPAALNVRLARTRAAAVEQLLRAEQVDAAYLSVDSFGESDPLVQTGDNVDEERNRRVEIVVR